MSPKKDFDPVKLEELRKIRESGQKLEVAQKIELQRLEKLEAKLGDTSSGSPVDTPKVASNVFGKTPTTKINPTSIRFVQTERDTLTSRKDTLVANCAEDIVERLGSIRFANETMLIRAAVRALRDIDDNQLLIYMKEAQRDMM
jgi:hypothetical protein